MHRHRRRTPAQHVDERIAAVPVAAAHPPDVAVQGSRGDQLRERQLDENVCAAVGSALGLDHGVEQAGGQHQPAEAQPRSQALAGTARVDDLLGGQTLQCPHGMAVIAEFAVVVVFDHVAVVLGRDRGELRASVRRQRRPQRRLMGRSQHRRGNPGRVEPVGAGAVAVDRQRHDVEPAGLCCQAVVGKAGIFQRDRSRSLRAQRVTHQPQPLGEAAADDDPLGGGGHTAYPAQVTGQDGTQLR